MATQLTNETKSQFINSNSIVLIDWYADWCAPCQRFLKVLPRLEEELERNNLPVKIGKINVDENHDATIRSIPTIIIYKNGEELLRWSGIKTINDIINILRNEINE